MNHEPLSQMSRFKLVAELLQSRSPTDAYYQAQYRVTDYHVIRRLRALGPEVEVLLPWDLREKIAQDIQQTWNHYR